MVLTRQVLAKEVSFLLGLPLHYPYVAGRKLVNCILDVIISALKRGERIEIDGLGIFELYERPKMRRGCYYFYGRKQKGLQCIVKDIPAKNYVRFKPSKVLKRLIKNAD